MELTASALDSARFGLRIGRLEITDSVAAQVSPAFLASDLDVLVVRHPASDVGVAAALACRGVTVLHADTLIHVEGGPSTVASPDDTRSFEVMAGEPSAQDVEAVLERSFEGYLNHYAANPLVDASRMVAGYVEWACAHLDQTDGFVVGIRDRASNGIAGIAAAAQRGFEVQVNLAGVLPEHRGQGVYQMLLDEVCRGAEARGAHRLTTSTQAHNLASLRAWARRGWLPSSAVQISHLVRSEHLDAISRPGS